ncbi:MAG: DUF3618 domain-containing protein [Actinomyces sp.]|uniref:DUF3618 domain-containing protein n=1 Tax=Actinomyces sp. TaxID=29317 RepID=UPI0026DAC30B|nr:DUF3618 domain-containing protein [Actinomyces sp.]MDO4243581.1 DUF3618 domain-containing protein [Actinomyces sp.]
MSAPQDTGARDEQAWPSPEEIEARLRAQREELAASVDDLAARVDPRTQARATGEQLRERARTAGTDLRSRVGDWGDRARATARRAQEGDSEALTAVLAVAGGVVATGLLVGRLLRR